MINALFCRIQNLKRELKLFIIAGFLLGLMVGMFETTFNNFLDDVYKISALARGQLELPRELPGLLVAVFSGLLFFMAETKMAFIAGLLICVGLVGMGFLSPGYLIMIIWLFIWSVGNHMYMPLKETIGIGLSKANQAGKRLGQLAGIETAAVIIGAGIVWIGMDYLSFDYRIIFALAAIAALGAGITFYQIDPDKIKIGENHTSKGIRSKLVLKKEYILFYWLNMLFGARKQAFITFAPWVLIQVYGEPASVIARLWMVSSILGVIFKPLLGYAIDRFGERVILMSDAVMVFIICLGYGFSSRLGLGEGAVYIIYVCFVLDQFLFSMGMARAIYLHKILTSPYDLTPTLSMGVSINHAVSMIVPVFGGIVWTYYGYSYVFLAAAFVAVINFISVSMIKTGSKKPGVEEKNIDTTDKKNVQ